MFHEHLIDWDDDKVSRLWNYYSKNPPFSTVYFSKLFGRQLLNKSGLPLGEPISVLDFGCGPGFIWDHLSASAIKWNYTGIDFSSEAVAILSKKAENHVQFKGAHHVTRFPTELPVMSFDAVLLFEVVEHLNDNYLDSTLLEIIRLLKDYGIIIVSTPHEENLADSTKFCPECGAIFHEWQHVRTWSVDTLTSYFAKYGFALVKVQTLDFSQTGILQKLLFYIKRIFKIKNKGPHMLAAFQKITHNDINY